MIWALFILLVVLLLALDLGVFNKNAHEISTKEATRWTVLWVFISLLFNALIYVMYENNWLGIGLHIGNPLTGEEAALKFFTGYLIEKSLSIDNIFVIAMIFAYFKIPLMYQHRVLFWGILGAIVFRGVIIVVGTSIMRNVEWVNYVFGGLLILSATKMLVTRHDNIEPYKNPIIRLIKRFYPIADALDGGKFFTVVNGKKAMTLLMVALLVIESTDIFFAVDSIPAIFAITTDAFIVFTSNIFAILGLRSLYFVLASMMDKFRYIKMSLVFVLAFVGVKMLLVHHFQFPVFVSLSVILGILLVGIISSVMAAKQDTAKLKSPLDITPD